MTHQMTTELTKDDVWGKWTDDHVKIHDGMVGAHSKHDENSKRIPQKCPIFKRKIDFKDVTIVGPKEKAEEIAYWIEYVQGANAILAVKDLPDNKIAFFCEYTAW